MDLRKIKKLIELIDETGVAEIEIREGEEAVRISRYGTTPIYQTPMPPSVVMPTTATVLPTDTNSPKDDSTLQGHVVRSPMVGTMYVSHAPEAEPFVKVGDRVKAGDTICIIEAMKMFNQIETDISGVIKACLAENGKLVEYDQPLFLIQAE